MSLRLLIAVLLALTATVSVALAQGGITASNPRVESSFAEYLRFSITLRSDSDVKSATVFVRYRVDGSVPTTSRGRAEFTSGKNVTAVFTRTLQRGEMAPGTNVEYYWQVENAAGQTLKTDSATYFYSDDRFDFLSLTSNKITVYWYGQDESYGRQRLKAAADAVERLKAELGLELKHGGKIFVYRSPLDMQDALVPRGRVHDTSLLTEGQTGYDTVILLGGNPDVDDVIKHELTHMVLHQWLDNPLIGGGQIPLWLNEGLAVYNQDNPGNYYLNALNRALRSDTVIPVPWLPAGSFGPAHQAMLFYGESYSIVKYLIEQYGSDKMLKLLEAFKRGAATEDAFREVYGFDLRGLDDCWRESVGLRSTGAGCPSTAPAGAVRQPTPAAPRPQPAAPAGPPLNCLCLAPLGLLLGWLFFRSH